MEKLWAAVSHQGTELLCEHSVPPVPLGSRGATSAGWQQEDVLCIVSSEEVGEQELAFPSEDVESDSMGVVKLSLLAELLPLIKRATAVLQVPWPTEGEIRQSIFDDKPTTSPVPPPAVPKLSFSDPVVLGSPGYSSCCFPV
ncbi:UNVERIFIED_CONTAM: hypothetical protein FKN15_029069 [Acipenser sinensis]